MRKGSPLQSLAASPTMVGAVTTLIVIVAVFLAYNANNGLPFVPVYRVSVEVPNGARLIGNNEVQIGGHRVGVVESIEPTRVTPHGDGGEASGQTGGSPDETCCVAARLDLKLDQSAGPLPEDSIFRVRYRSSFGLKYLEIIRGVGRGASEGYVFNGLDDGDSCPLPRDLGTFASTEPASSKNGCFQTQTEFDAINNTFDTRTRTNARRNLVGYGGGFAGRGASLNDAIEKLRPLFSNLKPVSEVLSDPATQLRRFIVALADTARIVAPVAAQQADFFTQAAITFQAISSDPAALRGTISEGAPLLEQGPAQLRRQRPFLTEFAKLSRRLNPGVRQLRIAIPTLNDAIQIGTPVLNRTPPMNRDLRAVLVELNRLVQQPSTKTSLQRLKDTFDTASPLAQFVAPAQTVCNYGNYWTTLMPGHLAERDQVGFLERVALVNVPAQAFTRQNLAGYSGQQSDGRAGPLPDLEDPIIADDFGNGDFKPGKFYPHSLPILHGSPYGPAGQPNFGQYPDCQPGQQGYPLGNFPVPGQAKWSPSFNTHDIPGSRGVTDVFFDQNGQRLLKDTRIPSHQP
jgi:phospholipid/cholesterol/gamma-HCH transport system substrate-binding protein